MKRALRSERTLLSLLIVLLPAQVGKHFWPTSAFVRGLRVDYLSPTIYLTDLLVIALLAASLGALLTKGGRGKRKPHYRKSAKFALSLAGIIGLLVIANFFSSTNPETTLYSWIRTTQLAALFVYLKTSSINLKAHLQRHLPIPVLYSSAIAFLQFVKQESVGGPLYWLGERRFTIATPGIAKGEALGSLALRPYATFAHPNALAGFVLVSLILLSATSTKEGRRQRHIRRLTYLAGATTLLLTASLSVWIVGVSLLAIAASRRMKKSLISMVALIGVVALALLALSPIEEQSITQRLQQAAAAATIVKTHPLFGVGLGNYIPSLEGTGMMVSQSPFLYFQPAHNIFLLFSAEAGLPIAVAFAWLIAESGRRSTEKKTLGITLALLAVVATGMGDHYWLTLHQNRLLFTVLLALGWR